MPNTEETQNPEPSTQRKVAAAVIPTTVVLVLNVGAGILINRLSKKIQNQIFPETTEN